MYAVADPGFVDGGAKVFFFSNHKLKSPDSDCTDNYMKKNSYLVIYYPFQLLYSHVCSKIKIQKRLAVYWQLDSKYTARFRIQLGLLNAVYYYY